VQTVGANTVKKTRGEKDGKNTGENRVREKEVIAWR